MHYCLLRIVRAFPLLCAATLAWAAVAANAAMLYTPEELQGLPAEGAAWEAVVRYARQPIQPNLSDQDDGSNVSTLALAMYAVRTGDESAAARVREIIRGVQGTEAGARSLAVGRELAAYVISADLVGLDAAEDARFRRWLQGINDRDFQGRTLRSTHEDRPNNWGTHAGASRIAVAAYLEDDEEIALAAHVFRGWLGELDGWRGFRFGETWWQPEGSLSYGINPAGAMIQGRSVDGVLPDDQRRSGHFRWPPPRENYVYEGLQGAITQALLLERQGYDPWEWGDKALLRAFLWLDEQADYPAEGDDTWMPHVINHIYGTELPAPSPSRPGKGMGFTDWTHSAISGGVPRPPSVGR